MKAPSLGDYLTEAQRKKLSKGQLKKLAKRERLEKLEEDRARRAKHESEDLVWDETHTTWRRPPKGGKVGYIPISELLEMAKKLERLERGYLK